MMIEKPTLLGVMFELHQAMKSKTSRIQPSRWQSIDVSTNPAAEMHELRWLHLHIPLGTRDLGYYKRSLGPDLPWADSHFRERVSGIPHNPQPSEETWPHGDGTNAAFRNEGKKHSHTYSERFWPKWADRSKESTPCRGIRYEYGDLGDLVTMLSGEPDTRQAILPVWFPEDTGIAHSGRKPCSLHYHFYRRGDRMDMEYSIRSCDYYRHFRNDVYLAIRLLIWMIEQCRVLDPPAWEGVEPGFLIMNIGSLHLFRNDYIELFGA